ncbi:ATP-binding protein [Allofournierella sp.]|uniref:ATP-binding protein n=1 Tax=Allofournierella sp. TaxID=1940256 RepID=UPI003AB8F887
MEQAKRKKGRRIFRMFLLPLVLILLAQAFISYGTVTFSGTFSALRTYSEGQFEQAVENRRLLLENTLAQQENGLQEAAAQLGAELEAFLQAQNLNLAEFRRDRAIQEHFLGAVGEDVVRLMRQNQSTGAFLVLASPELETTGGEASGLYLRDGDPLSNPGDYSDMELVRGAPENTQKLRIPLATLWQRSFRFQAPGSRDADDFFFDPYLAGRRQPELGVENLGSWNGCFCLEGNVENDAYRMITFTAPLLGADGQVYGVLGTELSETYLARLLPFQEVAGEQQGAYALLERSADGSYRTVFVNGPVGVRALAGREQVSFAEAQPGGLMEFLEITDAGRPLYAALKGLHLYNSNTPFAERGWYLAGIENHEALFGISEQLLRIFILATILALAVGAAGVYVAVAHVTGPIRRLSRCIQGSAENELAGYEPSNILEVDELYHTIHGLTEQQKQAEYALRQEKERYRLALQNSTDILLTLDMVTDQVEFVNLRGQEKVKRLPHFLQDIRVRDTVYPDDQRVLAARLREAQDEVCVTFRTRLFSPDGQYQWYELNGRVLRDAGGAARIIGSLRNVQQEKTRELEEYESLHRDPVTSLYRRASGGSIVQASVESGIGGCMLVLDIKGFLQFNERFNMAMGDAVLEEVGRLLRELIGQPGRWGAAEPVAVRLGGDEFLVWLEGADRAGAGRFVQVLCERAKQLYAGAGYQVEFAMGAHMVKGRGDYGQQLTMAQKALRRAKSQEAQEPVFYEDIPAEERKSLLPAGISQVARIARQGQLNLVSLAFNFFDKSQDVSTIMAVLLPKLGRGCGARHILLSQISWDFYTVSAACQWHAEPGGGQDTLRHWAPEEFQQQVAALQKQPPDCWRLEELSGRQRAFLLAPEDEGLALPMYDNGVYMGAVVFTGGRWNEEQRAELQEIVKIIEANLNRARYDLASRAKSDFLSRMSHEIRTPMNAIIGMTTLARQHTEDKAAMEGYLGKIDQSSQYLLGLINDVLDMSKIESGKMELAAVDFSLEQLLQEIGDLIAPQMEEKGIAYRTEVRVQSPWVYGDQLRLKQVLVNLLSNALKFTPQGGEVLLTVRQQEQNKVFFSVKDSGIGVSPEDAGRIFRSFEQAGPGIARQYGGTGLGLAISSRLVRMMGGEIRLESEVGKGSDFYFAATLPAGRPRPAGEQRPLLSEEELFCGKRVLLVEDNALNMEIAQEILEMKGFVVEQAWDGAEALERFKASAPGWYALVLMDIQMPVMDGLEATKEIRRLARPDAAEVPIVAMTANAFSEDMRKSVESGMNGHLAKPIEMKAFSLMLRQVLSKKQKRE